MKYNIGDNVEFLLFGKKKFSEITKKKGILSKKYSIIYKDTGGWFITNSVKQNRILGIYKEK